MSNCINVIKYNSSDVLYDQCQSTFTIWATQENDFTKSSLHQISDDCFDLTKARLKGETEFDEKVNRSIYKDLRNKIIDLILEFDPISFGFSISLEPSFHFIARFKNDLTLFFETYIDFEDGLETFVQIYKKKEPILSIKDSVSNGLFFAEETLGNEIKTRTKYLSTVH